MSIKQIAHYGIADEDALGGEAQAVVFGVDELSPLDIGLGTSQTVGVVAFAKVGLELGEVDAACCAQLGDDALVVALVGG